MAAGWQMELRQRRPSHLACFCGQHGQTGGDKRKLICPHESIHRSCRTNRHPKFQGFDKIPVARIKAAMKTALPKHRPQSLVVALALRPAALGRLGEIPWGRKVRDRQQSDLSRAPCAPSSSARRTGSSWERKRQATRSRDPYPRGKLQKHGVPVESYLRDLLTRLHSHPTISFSKMTTHGSLV